MKNTKEQIEFLRANIMESIHNIDAARCFRKRISEKDVDKISTLVESFVTLSPGDFQSDIFEKYVENISYEFAYRESRLNEGFENPFDDCDDLEKPLQKKCFGFYDDDCPKVKSVAIWNGNTPNKIEYKKGRMYAGKFFGDGDVIETCPVRLFNEQDMYSENVRKFAFPISRGVYGIPFGCATYYRNSTESKRDGNCRYEYVPSSSDDEFNVIRIIATLPIKKGSEIILKSDSADFANELKPGQFKYDDGKDIFYSVKNFKFI